MRRAKLEPQPSKTDQVKDYMKANPGATPIQIAADLGIAKETVYGIRNRLGKKGKTKKIKTKNGKKESSADPTFLEVTIISEIGINKVEKVLDFLKSLQP